MLVFHSTWTPQYLLNRNFRHLISIAIILICCIILYLNLNSIGCGKKIKKLILFIQSIWRKILNYKNYVYTPHIFKVYRSSKIQIQHVIRHQASLTYIILLLWYCFSLSTRKWGKSSNFNKLYHLTLTLLIYTFEKILFVD